MFIFFYFGHYIGRGRRSKIGGGDKHLYELERASCQVGKRIFSGWRKYHSGSKKVSFRVQGSTFSNVATRLGSSAEPSQQVC